MLLLNPIGLDLLDCYCQKNEIQLNMDKYLEPGLSFKINSVDKIDRPVSGKIKHFYSKYNQSSFYI